MGREGACGGEEEEWEEEQMVGGEQRSDGLWREREIPQKRGRGGGK